MQIYSEKAAGLKWWLAYEVKKIKVDEILLTVKVNTGEDAAAGDGRSIL